MVRKALVERLSGTESLQEAVAGKKARAKQAQGLIEKVSLVRDSDRRDADNQRRSKGFGFITFKDHKSAMSALEFLNDNQKVFGGERRPIVEFAIEDKRKLQMQKELYERHAHLPCLDPFHRQEVC